MLSSPSYGGEDAIYLNLQRPERTLRLKILFYSKRELKRVEEYLSARWAKYPIPPLKIERKGYVDEDRFLVFGDHMLVEVKGILLPCLCDEALLNCFPKVKVDAGAVKFLTNGANVMRPGIKGFEGSFQEGDIVVAQDERYGKSLAVGLALMRSEEARVLEKGAVIKNMHYVGDGLWRAYRQLSGEASGQPPP